MANDRIHRRLNNANVDEQRNDFMTYVLRLNDEKGVSEREIEATFRVLVIVGNETTAYRLVRHHATPTAKPGRL